MSRSTKPATVLGRAVVAPLMADRTFWQAIPGLIDALPADLRTRVEQIRAQPGAVQLEA